jgi:hypothetical protein
MKPFLFLFIAYLFLISCKKDKITQPISLVGSWNWFATYAVYPLGPTNPQTPANSGSVEQMMFNTNKTWKKIQNNLSIDSGTYSLGHADYTAYASKYVYDSIVYYKNGSSVGWDCYKISHDTLTAYPGYIRPDGDIRFSSYSLPSNGSKWWVKQ